MAALENGATTPPPDPPEPTGLTGKVYRDANGNGTQDAGEPGVSGQTVLAYNHATAQTTRTTTSASGDMPSSCPQAAT